MPVFISYSRQDRAFVDRLAVQLVNNKVNVWLDRWELHVGDSLLTKIQDAVSGASALLVILSKASVASEWCRKELNAGLMRELNEKRVVVLPILLEDCDIPVFLKEKLYADFRENFDEGLHTVVESIAKVTNQWMARIDAPEWHTDWAIDWAHSGGLFRIRLTLVEQAIPQPFSVLTIVEILCDAAGTAAYEQRRDAGNGEAARRAIIGTLDAAIERGLDLTAVLEDQFEKGSSVEIRDDNIDAKYLIRVLSRRLGEDTGRNILLHTGQQVRQIFAHMKKVAFSLQ
jgi:hypothetical protein